MEGAQLPLSQPIRADLPGALEHAGEVDEFDAALIRGAHGVTATPESGIEDEQAAPARREGPDAELGERAQAPQPQAAELQAPVVGDGGAAAPVEPADIAVTAEGELAQLA